MPESAKTLPSLRRYPGSTIGYYEVQNYQKYSIATGPEVGYRQIEKWTDVEGKFTRIFYIVKGETTLTEVYRNYLSALKKGGLKILAEGSNPVRTGFKVSARKVGFLIHFILKTLYLQVADITINEGIILHLLGHLSLLLVL
ncbi:MAG: hypothetical protein IPK10_02965 [Bacteroidetes bacterium]|nr:hypothetical protein [Bacteroidota bacterium]